MKYPQLFSRGQIGKLEVRNRIVKAAAHGVPGDNGLVTQRGIDLHAAEARGGAGLIFVGLAVVAETETPLPRGAWLVNSDGTMLGLSAVARDLQHLGAKAGLQIAHFGSHAHPAERCVSLAGVEHDIWYGAHHPDYYARGYYPHKEYTTDEIHELVADYGRAAWRAKMCGFDIVEIHGAHGHGLSCWLSPLTNQRTDAYGGSPENRRRILLEIVSEVRARVGNDYPLSVRLNGTEPQPGGLAFEEAVETARILEQMGVDLLNVSNQNAVLGMEAPLAAHVASAEAVKRSVRIPVMTCGSILTPQLAEEILANGSADFVGLVRPLFADPEWPNKAKTGRDHEIRPCIRCMDGCIERSFIGPVLCSVNPTLGRDEFLRLTPAERPKKVAVIGGGPAGLEAARVAALRGHTVTLFEKRAIGGALNEACVPGFKTDLCRLIDYYTHEMTRLGIQVVLREVDVVAIKQGGFEAVVLAVGGKSADLAIPGIESDKVVSALDVLRGTTQTGATVLVVGSGMVGVEVGLWLAEQGKDVTFAEMLDEFMPGNVESYYEDVYNKRLARQTVTKLLGHKLCAVEDGTAVLENVDGRRTVLADTIVMAVGFKPQLELREQIEHETGIEVIAIGDCSKPGKVFDAVHSGYICGRQL